MHTQSSLPDTAPSLIAACAPMEEHELGLLLLALVARRQGWHVTFLGQCTPLGDIDHIAQTINPKVFAVSVTTIIGLTGLIPWLDAVNRPAPTIIFGGRLVNAIPSLHDHLPGLFLGENVFDVVNHLIAIPSGNTTWSPSKFAWNAARALLTHRSKIAGDSADILMKELPTKIKQNWNMQDLIRSTIYLIDTLVCTLVFNTPDIVDVQSIWLRELIKSWSITSNIVNRYIDIVERVLNNSLQTDQLRPFIPLFSHMRNNLVA